MEQYQRLRERFPRFYYRGYEASVQEGCLEVTYRFETEGLAVFEPQWRFPIQKGEKDWLRDGLLREMLFSLGMAELVSYWKLTCSPRVIVEAGDLDEEQTRWWKKLYFNGLGEFFHVNGIEEADPEGFMALESTGVSSLSKEGSAGAAKNHEPALSGGFLVPVGGGKDSAVTLDLLLGAGFPVYGYIINPRGATLNTAARAGLGDRVMKASRTLDKRMLELNKEGYLNGHTPFSAVVAFSGLIGARLLGLPYIALSNESSANESTVPGSRINHQYSKSFEFERDFHQYAARYLPGSAYYFSLLRPLSEFQIARYFAGLTQYHDIFRSCNSGSKTDSWCGSCPKCLFVYLILSPFLSRKAVTDIFGRDMLEDSTMKENLEKLVGIAREKPFECVGSRDEINTALMLTINQIEAGKEPLPFLLSYYKNSGLYFKYRDRGDRYSSYFDDENLLPGQLLSLVREKCVQGIQPCTEEKEP